MSVYVVGSVEVISECACMPQAVSGKCLTYAIEVNIDNSIIRCNVQVHDWSSCWTDPSDVESVVQAAETSDASLDEGFNGCLI